MELRFWFYFRDKIYHRIKLLSTLRNVLAVQPLISARSLIKGFECDKIPPMPHLASGNSTLEEGGVKYVGESLPVRMGRSGDCGRRFYPRLYYQQASLSGSNL